MLSPGSLQLNLNITARTNDAPGKINPTTRSVQELGVASQSTSSYLSNLASVANQITFSNIVNGAKLAINNLDTLSTSLRTTSNIAVLAGGNFSQYGGMLSKTSGQIDGFTQSAGFLKTAVTNAVAPTTLLAKYTVGLSNTLEYAAGRFDATYNSAKLVYAIFDLMPPKIKAYMMAMGTANLIGHTTAGTFNLISHSIASATPHVLSFATSTAHLVSSIHQIVTVSGQADAMVLSFSTGLSRLSEMAYTAGSVIKFTGGQYAWLGELLLKGSGALSASNFAFNQLSRTLLGTGSSLRIVTAGMRLLTIQPDYVGTALSTLVTIATNVTQRFMALGYGARALVVSLVAVGATARIVGLGFTVLKTSVTLLQPAFAAFGIIAAPFLNIFRMLGTLMPLAGYYFVKSSDSLAMLSGRMKLSTESAQELSYAQRQLIQTSVQTGSSIESNANIFTKAAKPLRDMGLSASNTVAVIDTLGTSLTLAGAQTSEVNSVLQQTGQMLNKGTFSGDEFMSLMENGDLVMQNLSEALGKTKGELIEMSHAQQLTSDMFAYGMLRAFPKMQAQFESMPMTMGRAFGQLTTLVKLSSEYISKDVNSAATSISHFATNSINAIQSGQLKNELLAIQEDFSLISNDVQQTLGILTTNIKKNVSFDGFFTKTRTALRIGFVEVIKDVQNYAENVSYWFNALTDIAFTKEGMRANRDKNSKAYNDAVNANNDAAELLIGQAIDEQNKSLEKQNALRAKGEKQRADYMQKIAAEKAAIAADATAQANAMQAGIEQKLAAAGIDKAKQKELADAQIKNIKSVTEAQIAGYETAKELNDSLFAEHKITNQQHYQTELDLISKIEAAKTQSYSKQAALQKQSTDIQITDIQRAYQAILKIESAGGKTGQVNVSSHALGQMQVLPSTLRDPGYGVKPFQPAIDQNITKAMSYNRLLEFVRQNEEGLKKFGQDYFSGLVKHYGSIDKAVNAYGEHTAAYMAKFKQYYAQIGGQTQTAIDMTGDLASVQSDADKARIKAAQEYQKQNDEYLKSIDALKLKYIELTGTAEQSRLAQIEQADKESALRQQAMLNKDVATLALLDSVKAAEIDKEFTDRLKSLREEALQLEMTSQEWAVYQNSKITNDPAKRDKLDQLTMANFNSQKQQKILEYKVSFNDKALQDGLAKAQRLATGLKNAFGGVGQAVGGMIEAMANYSKVLTDVEVQRKAVVDNELSSPEQIANANLTAADQVKIAELDKYGSMTESAKSFFKEGTAGYKVMDAATKAFRLYEMALSAESMTKNVANTASQVIAWVTGENSKTAATTASVAPEVAASIAKGTAKAGEAVANQGSGDPYTAFARIAMMIALMAAVGFSVGGGGGGSVPVVNLAEERQKTQGTGSVLGDVTAKSKSISNSLELLKSNSDIMLPLTSNMANSLKNIENNIGGLGNMLGRSMTTNKLTFTETPASGGSFLSNIPILGGLFGGGKTKTLADSGLSVAAQSVGDIIATGMMNASQYIDIQVTKKSFFGGTKSWIERQTAGVDAEMQVQFSKVIGSLVGAIDIAAGSLDKSGTNFQAVLDSFVVNIGDVSLKGLKGAELQAELEAVFGRIGDDMARTAFAGLADFQKVGEGYFETLVRVASGVEQATVGLERFGIKAVAYTDIITKQGDVFAEIVRQSVIAQETAAKGIIDIIQLMDGTGSDLLDTYKQLSAIRDTMNLNGLAGNNISRATVTGAGGLSELQSAVSSYTDNYFSDAEKLTAAITDISAKFVKLGVAMPASTTEFRSLVESIDTSTESGQKFQGQILSLSETFFTASDLASKAVDNMQSSVDKAESDLKQAYQTESGLFKKAIDDFGNFAKSLKEYLDSLVLSDLSTKTPLQKYQEAKKQFDAVNTLINTGTDAQKQEGLGKLQGVTQSFLETSRGYNASSMGYIRDFATATAALNNGIATATTSQDINQLQLNALTDSVSQLIKIDGSVLSVKQAIDALAIAQVGLKDAQNAMAKAAQDSIAAAKTESEKQNYQRFSESEAKRFADYQASLKAAAQAQNPLNTVAPDTYINGQTTNVAWEQILSASNAAHQARFGIPMNRPWNADQDAVNAKSVLDAQYKDAAIAQNATVVQATIDALRVQQPFIPQSYDALKRYADGGVSNVPAIFGEAGPEAAIPLKNGSVPVQFINSNQNDNSELVAELKQLIKKQDETIAELKLQNELIKAGIKVDQFGYKELIKQGESQAESLDNMDRRERLNERVKS